MRGDHIKMKKQTDPRKTKMIKQIFDFDEGLETPNTKDKIIAEQTFGSKVTLGQVLDYFSSNLRKGNFSPFNNYGLLKPKRGVNCCGNGKK